jgi:hypothetical protein
MSASATQKMGIDEVTLVCSGAYGANEDLVNRISEAQKQYGAVG